MTITPQEYIEAPDPGRLRYGLFTVSPPVEREMRSGFVYDTDYCGTADLTQVQCVASAAKTFVDEADRTEAPAFAVYAGTQCGSVGFTDEEFAEKARTRLAAGEQGAVELALWTGLDSVGGAPLDINGFNNSSPTAVTVGLADNLEHIVARLEEFAYRTSGYGYDAYIHAPVITAAFAAERQLIVQDGDLKRTPYGSIWVFGGGYPGTNSTGAEPAGTAAIYITGKVNVWRSSDIFVPDVAQTLDRETNQQYVLAEREYAVGFDCFLGEATFDYPSGP